MVNTNQFVASYEGTLVHMSQKQYYLSVILSTWEKGKNYLTHYRLYDIEADLFKRTITIGSVVKGRCTCDLVDKHGVKYNKISSFTLVKKGTSHKKLFDLKPQNDLQNIILQGTITNTNNTRDKVKKDELSFCLKTGKTSVEYIAANKSIADSMFFKKGNKIKVEAKLDKRANKSPNRTFKLVNLWSLE